MATDNVDIFKKVIFSIPSARKTAAAMAGLGLLYSVLFYLALGAFAGNLLDLSALSPALVPTFWMAVFLLPALVSGELMARLLPDYPRKWGYFLAMCNQLVLFFYLLVLSGANNIVNAWNVIWLATTTIFLSNLLVLLLTLGYSHVKRIAVLSTAHPLLVIGSFHVILGAYLRIPFAVYVLNIGIIFLAGLLLLVAFGLVEYLLRANVSNVSVLKLTSALLQKKQESLDLGYPTNPEVQTLEIENESGEARVAVPWIHPGPLEGFGGGRITGDIIEELNRDGDGFFFHVPSTHRSDPTNPDDYRKILDALEEPEKTGEASRLISQEYELATFHGRRVNGRNIVFMDMDYDDAELSVFREAIDTEETLLVDLHNHEMTQDASKRQELWYNTEESREVRENLQEFIDRLEKQEIHEYRAGFSSDTSGTPVFALVEEVDGQETLLFGIEGNEASPELLELEERYREEFDEVILFTTDTHQSIHDLSSWQQVDPDRVIESVEAAQSSVSRASMGFTSANAESMNLLQEDYSGLIMSINILVRLIPLTLILLYLGLIIWLF
jgi:putative membrane protein